MSRTDGTKTVNTDYTEIKMWDVTVRTMLQSLGEIVGQEIVFEADVVTAVQVLNQEWLRVVAYAVGIQEAIIEGK
jgi:hypothetical protein